MPRVPAPAIAFIALAALALIGAVVLLATDHSVGQLWSAFFASLSAGAGVAIPAHHTTAKSTS